MADPAKVELSGAFPRRGALRGRRGCVAADHPLAAQAGMAVLREGGSAADAVVAMGAVMTVVQPQYSQLGGDGFAVVWDQAKRSVTALNSAGAAPMSLDREGYRALGRIPLQGGLAVTVPGVVAGWWALHQRHGRLPWKRLFAAMEYARDGFPASRGLWRALQSLGQEARAEFPFDVDEGEPLRQPALARTLEAIADGGQDAFYSGTIGDACRGRLAADGAVFEAEEWSPPARWLEPVVGKYRGHRVWASPPQTQGFVLPLALALTPGRSSAGAGEPSQAVAMCDALRSALGVRERELSDPDVTGFDPRRYFEGEELERLRQRAKGGERVGSRADGDTTYILAIDAEGNAVSWIQSVFWPWGSRVWVPEHGVLMNNRMTGFTLEPGHPNEIAPGKRPAHTLHAYLVTRPPSPPAPLPRGGGSNPTEELAVVGGTPGGYRQPQNNMQILDHILREGMDVQDALDEPRWSVAADGPGGRRRVEVEVRAGNGLAAEFEAAGMEVLPFSGWDGQMGRPYVAVREREGGIAVGADLRGEGQALVW